MQTLQISLVFGNVYFKGCAQIEREREDGIVKREADGGGVTYFEQYLYLIKYMT